MKSLYGGQTLLGELHALATYRMRTDYKPDLSADPPAASSREVAFTVAAGGRTPVTAYGTKDLNEPQNILLVNSTDRVFIDGALWTAGEARTIPALIGQISDAFLDPGD